MSAATERHEIHVRQIDLRFYKRSDGLYEVEGRLLDRKNHTFRRLFQEHDLPAGTPLHDIVVRLVVDEDLRVHDASARLSASPYEICRGASETLVPLIGLKIGAGWNKQIREVLGGAASCTHIREILGPMATTAYQGLAPQRLARMQNGSSELEGKIDSCYAYGRDREIVAQFESVRKAKDIGP